MAHTTASRKRSQGQAPATALEFARRAHRGQRRKQTGEDYIEHPIAVAAALDEMRCDDAVVAASYLHDVLEQSDVSSGEIAERFGPEVAALVSALTEDASIAAYGARKRALRGQVLAAGRDAALVYGADRVANIRDWRRRPAAERGAIAERLGTSLAERLELWSKDLEELSAFDPELPFLGEIEIGLRELRAEAGSH